MVQGWWDLNWGNTAITVIPAYFWPDSICLEQIYSSHPCDSPFGPSQKTWCSKLNPSVLVNSRLNLPGANLNGRRPAWKATQDAIRNAGPKGQNTWMYSVIQWLKTLDACLRRHDEIFRTIVRESGNPVALSAHTIQWLAGYPLSRVWHKCCSVISCLTLVEYNKIAVTTGFNVIILF